MNTTTRCATCHPLTTAELAAQDQAAAHHRYWSGYDMADPFVRRMWRLGCTVIGLTLMAGGYTMMGMEGYVPLPSWSPAGQVQIQERSPAPVPVEPAEPQEQSKPEVSI